MIAHLLGSSRRSAGDLGEGSDEDLDEQRLLRLGQPARLQHLSTSLLLLTTLALALALPSLGLGRILLGQVRRVIEEKEVHNGLPVANGLDLVPQRLDGEGDSSTVGLDIDDVGLLLATREGLVRLTLLVVASLVAQAIERTTILDEQLSEALELQLILALERSDRSSLILALAFGRRLPRLQLGLTLLDLLAEQSAKEVGSRSSNATLRLEDELGDLVALVLV